MRPAELVVALCAILASSSSFEKESRVVKTSQGSIRGFKDGDVFEFKSIPYAMAPRGIHRFLAPLPGPIWLETRDAVEKGVICPQARTPGFDLLGTNRTMKDDCLFANVYVPDTNEKNLPVVVYVHGGAFQVGFGDLATPKNLVLYNKKIIAVTFNYRLGVHGFLCLGTKDAPGNAGMKDQVALLRWVQKNIANFGGNPDDVTIAGFSAGSAAVDLLQLSKSANGLFKKIIPESGASIGFAVQVDPLENAKSYAKVLGFDNVDDVYALEEFYKTTPWDKLMVDAFLGRTDSSFVFVPCVERDTGAEKFLEEAPVNILKSGNYPKLPLLYGFSHMEGIFRIEMWEHWKPLMNQKFSDFLPFDLKFENDEERELVAQKVKKFYFGDETVDDKNILKYVDFHSDVTFTFPMLWAVKLHLQAGHGKIYLYDYEFTSEDSVLIPHANIRGATHCAQTFAVLDMGATFNPDETTLSEETKTMKKIMRNVWNTFISSGKPVLEGTNLPYWPPVSSSFSPYMSIGRTLELKGNLLEQRFKFWEAIYDKYYNMPQPPPAPPIRHNEL